MLSSTAPDFSPHTPWVCGCTDGYSGCLSRCEASQLKVRIQLWREHLNKEGGDSELVQNVLITGQPSHIWDQRHSLNHRTLKKHWQTIPCSKYRMQSHQELARLNHDQGILPIRRSIYRIHMHWCNLLFIIAAHFSAEPFYFCILNCLPFCCKLSSR